MFIRHGMPWWNELFGDNHWRRLMLGRHGDRGSFEYFLRELAYGTLPWGALVPAALAAAGFGDAPEPRRSALRLGAIWFVCSYALVSSSITKFHHYALPAVPGLGLVVGLYLDAQLGAEDGRARRAAAAVGLPLLALVAANALHAFNAPQIFLWLFSYDYIPHPKGRPWPAGLEVRPAIALPIALAAAALALAGWRRGRRLGLAGFGVAAIVLTLVLLDGFLPSAARHWSQKETIAAYFRARRSADERLLAYFLFWRGETFYTKNAIHEGPPGERTVFDGDDAAAVDARLAAWLAARAGQRHFLLYEPAREARLRALLPPGAAARFEVVEQPNPKFRLARVDL
jgi:hypothetical protein